MANTPHISTAPRNVIDLPKDSLEAFRLGWACGQIDMIRRFWKRESTPLTKDEYKRLINRILNGRAVNA